MDLVNLNVGRVGGLMIMGRVWNIVHQRRYTIASLTAGRIIQMPSSLMGTNVSRIVAMLNC
jgi:uncharacterized membrane protein YqgA involved in biofilm formation